MVAWVSRNLFDHVTYTVRRGLLKGLKRRGGLAWLPESLAPSTVTAEEAFWQAQNLAGMTVYDVGAFQGLMTLFFATRAGRVVAYEPNSVNRARLMKNLELNRISNVTIRPVGVGAEEMRATMVNSVDMPGGASIDPGVAQSIQKEANVHVEEIEVVMFDKDLAAHGLPAPDLIKIDVEGLDWRCSKGPVPRSRPGTRGCLSRCTETRWRPNGRTLRRWWNCWWAWGTTKSCMLNRARCPR